MKINELRLNNWVYSVTHKGNYKITLIDKYRLYDHVEPIQLTEDVLFKCGFEYKTNLWESKVYRLNEWFISFESGICVFGFKKTTKSPYTMLKNDIKYLHQLQNLYFALTGEELEIKL